MLTGQQRRASLTQVKATMLTSLRNAGVVQLDAVEIEGCCAGRLYSGTLFKLAESPVCTLRFWGDSVVDVAAAEGVPGAHASLADEYAKHLSIVIGNQSE